MAERRLAIGEKAPDFDLPGVDGNRYSLGSFKTNPVVVVMFTCNHCPYVLAYEQRLIDIQSDYADQGVALVAVNANETRNYPEDDFPKMVDRAKAKGYNFPYLRDETQEVADAYGAHYTPEVFVLDHERRLRYTGRIDDNWQHPDRVNSKDLREAIDSVLSGKTVKHPETHAMGCTIKWAKL
ncbi:MAG TPA: thioredoxin family protein, partial [Nitrospiria bacterium]|nr:thioredoxin family protein [Nitrospiria bacterium]